MPRAESHPLIYVIAGCNGSGKTTFARHFLAEEADCPRFLNADEIARGLSPLDPQAVAIKAGRVLISEIDEAVSLGHSFGLETTLSGLTHARLLRRVRTRGYEVKLIYLWLASPNLAVRRVRERVRKGGMGVAPIDIRRRFHRSLQNLFRHYIPLADSWLIFDNNRSTPVLVALGQGTAQRVVKRSIFDRIRVQAGQE